MKTNKTTRSGSTSENSLAALYLLALLEVLLALVSAEEELSVEELYGYHSEDEVEEEVDHQDVEHILERVDDAVEHSLELGHSLDRLQRPEDAEHAKGLDRAQVLTRRAPSGEI